VIGVVSSPIGPIILRSAGPSDDAFQRELFEAVRAAQWAGLPLDEAQRSALVDMQFRARSQHYIAAYPKAKHRILTLRNQPVGSLVLNESETEVLIVDIAVSPSQQGKGIGTALLNDLISRTRTSGKELVLHVERSNRAIQLYQRLGFEEAGDDRMYARMVWSQSKSPHL